MIETPTIDWQHPDYGPIWERRMQALQRLRDDPDQVESVKAYYASQSPAQFINDWGCTFDPRNVELDRAPTMPFLLFPKQVEFIEWIYERWRKRENGLCEKSRDMGITWLCAGFAVWGWLFKPGFVAGFGSRKEEYVDKLGDPKSIFWKIRTFIDLLPREFKPKGYDPQKHAPFMRIMNPDNEAVIVGEAGDNIGRGNRASIYFKDESAHYEHPESIDQALSQTSNCSIDLSSVKGEGTPFWRKRHGGRVPVFIFDWRDDPRKGQEWYEAQVEKHADDPVIVAQEIDRDYTAAVTNSFIPGTLVTEAQRLGPADVTPVGPMRIGLDVARFGDDRCVLTFRRGRVVTRQMVWGQTSLTSTAGRVLQEVRQYKRAGIAPIEQIAVDTCGLGAGVADMLRGWADTRDLVVDVNGDGEFEDGECFNLRAFCWKQMKEWLGQRASLPNDQELRADLCSLRYEYRGGLLLIESKKQAKARGIKSPDRADSLALTFAYPGPAKEPERPRGYVAHYEADAVTGM